MSSARMVAILSRGDELTWNEDLYVDISCMNIKV